MSAGLEQTETIRGQVHFCASGSEAAQEALESYTRMWGQAARAEATLVVALGGDGFMLEALGRELSAGAEALPVLGIHHGTIGFLMNARHAPHELEERVRAAQSRELAPLKGVVRTLEGTQHEVLALNEISVRRTSAQAASLRVSVNGTERISALAGDGILCASPAGSAAYNFSAGGPILPLGSGALALTGICTIRPVRWPGAVIADTSTIEIEVLESAKRPVELTADQRTLTGIAHVSIKSEPERAVRVLFDAGHDLDERLLSVQFPTS